MRERTEVWKGGRFSSRKESGAGVCAGAARRGLEREALFAYGKMPRVE